MSAVRRIELAPDSDTILVDGARLPARPQSHRLIALLLTKPGELVEYEALRAHFGWPPEKADICTRVAVCHARQALADARARAIIVPIFKRGYRLQVLT